MHGGRELVREENVAEMEVVKGAANRDFEQRHSTAPEAGKRVRKLSGREKNDVNRGKLDERRQ
jgi:hypothetical protein